MPKDSQTPLYVVSVPQAFFYFMKHDYSSGAEQVKQRNQSLIYKQNNVVVRMT